MVLNDDDEYSWGSRRIYVMVVLCQIMGLPMFVGLANTAVTVGATGYILAYIACCLLTGIPLLYMEFIISQFTARDCIDVWKARPCISHIGYILVLWQVIDVLYNHLLNSFVFHYLLISFENPIPYYTCGSWSTNSCNILVHNFTVNEDCIRLRQPPSYCDYLYTSFPEFQYWRFQILGTKNSDEYHIAWRVCLASGLICVIMFFSVVRRYKSVEWVAHFFCIFPVAGYVIILMGSMLQKGVVVKYDEALDSDFSEFLKEFSVSNLMLNTVYTIGTGTGAGLNLARRSAFRAPVYSDSVLAVVALAAASTLAICISAMMSCPYSYEYGVKPFTMLKLPMSLIYEKTPRFLYEYRYKYFYLVLLYGCHASLGTGTNIIYILQMVDMAAARSTKVAQYPGLTSFLGILFIFCISIPLLCNTGIRTLVSLKRHSYHLAVLVTIAEIVVFIIWYGMDRFSEDVHFMQGLQPKSYMKFCWILSLLLLSYTFCIETYEFSKNRYINNTDTICWYVIQGTTGVIVVVLVLKLAVAACRRRLPAALALQPGWGPRSALLQRSRAMFTAQAMTKEYLYRQYHLQAGVAARQARACRRAPTDQPDASAQPLQQTAQT